MVFLELHELSHSFLNDSTRLRVLAYKVLADVSTIVVLGVSTALLYVFLFIALLQDLQQLFLMILQKGSAHLCSLAIGVIHLFRVFVAEVVASVGRFRLATVNRSRSRAFLRNLSLADLTASGRVSRPPGAPIQSRS